MAMHLSDRMFETHLSTPISQTFALIAGDCNGPYSMLHAVHGPPAWAWLLAAATLCWHWHRCSHARHYSRNNAA
jgi:hypothetical protein